MASPEVLVHSIISERVSALPGRMRIMLMVEDLFSKSTKKSINSKRSMSGLFSISQGNLKVAPRISTESASFLTSLMHLLSFTTELRSGPSSTTPSLRKSVSSKNLSSKIFTNNFYLSQISLNSSQSLKITRKTPKKRRIKKNLLTSLKIDFIDIL